MLISILVLWYTGLLFVSHVNHWLKSDSFFYSSLFVACSCQGKTSRYRKNDQVNAQSIALLEINPHGSRGMKSFDFADICRHILKSWLRYVFKQLFHVIINSFVWCNEHCNETGSLARLKHVNLLWYQSADNLKKKQTGMTMSLSRGIKLIISSSAYVCTRPGSAYPMISLMMPFLDWVPCLK